MKHFSYIILLALIVSCHNDVNHHHGHNHEAGHQDSHVQTHNHERHHEHEEAHEAGHSHEVEHNVGHIHEDEHKHSSGEIILTQEAALRAGVECELIIASDFTSAIRCSGQILPSGSSVTNIISPASGIIKWENDLPSVGQKVYDGMQIASILTNVTTEGDGLTKARIRFKTASKEYERAKKLKEDRIISEKDFNSIEEEYLNARNIWRSFSSGKTNGGIAITSPSDAYINSVLVNQGEYVQASETIATICSNSKLRLQAELPEKYANTRSLITGADFRQDYLPNVLNIKDLNGKLSSVGQSAYAGYIPITFELANDGKLLPGTYAEVWLLTHTRNNVISLPESALIEEQGEYFVYIQIDEDCYRKQAVHTGARNGTQIEIVSGIQEGEKVVVKGAYQVKLASASVIPGHSHNH